MGEGGADGGLSLTQRLRPFRAAILLAASFSAWARPGAAQSIEDYWRELRAQPTHTVALATAAPPTVPPAIAEALRLFRAYELSGDEDAARRAHAVLRRADVAPADRAWHTVALAMVLARGPDSRVALGDDRVVDPNSLGSMRSLRLLRRALELDPGMRVAALELATWALDRDHPGVAAEADSALARAGSDGEVLATRASLNLLLGRYRQAASLAELAEQMGADPGVVLHVRAWALFQDLSLVEEAITTWYAGLDADGAAGQASYFRALAPIMDEEEAEAWRTLEDGSARRAWATRFWRRAAARAGVLPHERIAEHYRRLHQARVHFPVVPLSVLQVAAPYMIDEDSRRFGLSLRGLMLVRHGDPHRLAFIEPCLSNPWPSGSSGTICSELGNRHAAMQQVTQLAAGDSYDPFARELPFDHEVFVFRAPDGGSEVVYAVGLHARSANALVESSNTMTGILTTVLLPDTGAPIRRDSMFSGPIPTGVDAVMGAADSVTLLVGALRAPPGPASYAYRVTVSDRRRHAGQTGAGVVETYPFRGLSLSDVAVAPAGMEVGWRRGDARVAFAPAAVYLPGETVALYYEVYGLAEDTPYRTEIELTPRDRSLGERLLGLIGRDGSIRLRFEGRAPAPHPVFGLQESRTIQLNGVKPGEWNLRVRVTDLGSDRETARESTIVVVP